MATRKKKSIKLKTKAIALSNTVVRINKDKDIMLAKLETTPIVQVAATKAGVSRATYYRWCNEDENFKARAEEILQKGRAFVSDMAESQLMKKISEGNLTATIFWLKNHRKEYMDIHRYEYLYKVEVASVLTEERKAEIATVMKNWSKVDYEDSRIEDYEIPWEDESRGGKAKSDGSNV
jgi:hypothetical protein